MGVSSKIFAGMSHQIKLALNAAADKSKALLTEVASFEIKVK